MTEQIVCPVCQRGDQLEWVGNILDKGTMRTSTVGIALNPHDGFTPMIMGGTSSTDFTQRFAPPRMFGRPTFWGVLGVLALSIVVWDIIIAASFFRPVTFVTWIVAMIMGLIGAIFLGAISTAIIEVIKYAIRAPQRRFWQYAYTRLWHSVYCARDNAVFSRDYCASPQAYVQWLFTPPTRRPALGYSQGA